MRLFSGGIGHLVEDSDSPSHASQIFSLAPVQKLPPLLVVKSALLSPGVLPLPWQPEYPRQRLPGSVSPSKQRVGFVNKPRLLITITHQNPHFSYKAILKVFPSKIRMFPFVSYSYTRLCIVYILARGVPV